MKALLISIKPKWVSKILNGEKTIEVRKSKPKCDLPIDVYIYCTKDKELLHKNCVDIYWVEDKDFQAKNKKFGIKTQPYLNGKVVAKFTLNKVEEITPFEEYESPFGMAYKLKENKIVCCQKAQLTYDEYNHYLKGKKGYAWHISNLVIFDRPKELSEFKHYNKPSCDSCPFQYSIECDYHREVECDDIPLTKSPQSYMFIEVVGDK